MKGGLGMSAMKRAALLMVGVMLCALSIALLSDNVSYEDRLISAGLEEALGPEARELVKESPEVQALFLDYSESMELVLKAKIAIAKYGDDARNVLQAYGTEPEFKEILRKYGDTVIPVVQYFVANDPLSARMTYAVQEVAQNVSGKAKQIWHRVVGEKEETPAVPATPEERSFGPTERGWYAVQNILSGGHDFLGQFALTSDNKIMWIQTERLIEGASDFFISGIRSLETKYALDEEIKGADLFWAGVDAAVVASAVKALRAVKVASAGKAARAGEMAGQAMRMGEAARKSGEELSILNRTKLLAGRLVPKNAFGKAILKGGAGVALLYVAAKHPGILNSIFAEAATLLGLNPFLAKMAFWAVLICAIFLPLTPLLRLVLPVLIRLFSMLVSALDYLESLFARSKPVAVTEVVEVS